MISADELREVLEAIERGDVTLTHVGRSASEVYAGDVTYKTSNGWTIVVFNDCDSWDYLDSAVAPDGRRAEYPSGYEEPEERGDLYELFMSYAPPVDVQHGAYGFAR